MLKKIESLIVTSENYDDVVSFFKDKLGFEMPVNGADMTRFELNGFPLFVARSEKGNNLFISIETDNIESDYSVLKEKGIDLPEPVSALKGGDKASFFRGPLGVEFMLYQPAPGENQAPT
jgi:hypothetical protein